MAMANLRNPELETRNPELGSARTRAVARGFTILELLVVIFIMLAMAGIAVAAFGKFLDTERIKLAGGQVAGAIRMARQYAMSKRCKVMVEFMSPDSGSELTTQTLASSDAGFAHAYSGQTGVPHPGQMAIYEPSSYRRFAFAKFDLSALSGPEHTIMTAILKIKASSYWYHLPVAVTVKGVSNDTWTGATLDWDNYATYPADGGTLGNTSVAAMGSEYEINISAFVETERAGDGTVSVRFETTNGDRGLSAFTASLYLEVEKDTGESAESVAHLPRSVRIIPYIRDRNAVTGGFSWLLDQDFNHLKEMELPRNLHYVLTPQKIAIDQYDPGDLIDHKSTARKVFFDLMPDGSCRARPPDLEGWSNRVNTVILHDAVTNDLALLFVPPASAFTRQRYLFMGEVEAFVAAHSLYSLW
jgi:type II secretory pathway pseudopilin PulG